MKIKTITGCSRCLFRGGGDGRVRDIFCMEADEYYKSVGRFETDPGAPEWCPLKKAPVLIELKGFEDFRKDDG